jgi:hypothetical protein
MEPTKQKPDGEIRLKQNMELGSSSNCGNNIGCPSTEVQNKKIPKRIKEYFKYLSLSFDGKTSLIRKKAKLQVFVMNSQTPEWFEDRKPGRKPCR